MKGKLAVLIIILVTIVVLIFCWIWLQGIMDDYDIEQAISVTTLDTNTR